MKVRHEIDLVGAGIDQPSWAPVRRLTIADRDALAQLLLDAYVGTIDYEGETLAEAGEEVGAWLAGSPLLAQSYGLEQEGRSSRPCC